MRDNAIIRKITSGYQITIPNEFRKTHHLDVGSMISISSIDEKLIIEPFQYKSAALKKLEALFANTPDEFKDLDESEVIDLVDEEIKDSRK